MARAPLPQVERSAARITSKAAPALAAAARDDWEEF
jgi:hypothetical protein